MSPTTTVSMTCLCYRSEVYCKVDTPFNLRTLLKCGTVWFSKGEYSNQK